MPWVWQWAALAVCGGLLAGCGSAAGPGTSGGRPASASPAASSGTGALEQKHLEIAIASTASGYGPVLVAKDGGDFAQHGLDVNLNVVSSSTGAQAVVSGSADMYQGGGTAIAAHLEGADIIYAAAAVDLSTLLLVGQKGITTVEELRGKQVSTLQPGTFGDIAMRRTAKQHGLEIDKDIKLVYNPTSPAAVAAFQAGQVAAVMVPSSWIITSGLTDYPVIVDYYKDRVKIIGPGMAVQRSFFKNAPNTLKAYMEGYLDGVKRAFDDPAFAKQIDAKYNKISDQKTLDTDYDDGRKVWNKDMTVEPVSIQITLDSSADPKAKAAKVGDFYDNTLIQQVNRDYASKLFPGGVKV
ncbi:MAG TPA: ABC transporter substrate-binding protein [Chloroflexota bacterium]